MAASSAEALASALAKLGITVERNDHAAVASAADAAAAVAKAGFTGTACKNLLLSDKKKKLWLLVAKHDAAVDLTAIGNKVKAAKPLRFATPEVLLEVLGVTPGAVSPLALIADAEAKRVTSVLLDRGILLNPRVCFHPLVNTATIEMRTSDLLKFNASTGHETELMDFETGEAPGDATPAAEAAPAKPAATSAPKENGHAPPKIRAGKSHQIEKSTIPDGSDDFEACLRLIKVHPPVRPASDVVRVLRGYSAGEFTAPIYLTTGNVKADMADFENNMHLNELQNKRGTSAVVPRGTPIGDVPAVITTTSTSTHSAAAAAPAPKKEKAAAPAAESPAKGKGKEKHTEEADAGKGKGKGKDEKKGGEKPAAEGKNNRKGSKDAKADEPAAAPVPAPAPTPAAAPDPTPAEANKSSSPKAAPTTLEEAPAAAAPAPAASKPSPAGSWAAKAAASAPPNKKEPAAKAAPASPGKQTPTPAPAAATSAPAPTPAAAPAATTPVKAAAEAEKPAHKAEPAAKAAAKTEPVAKSSAKASPKAKAEDAPAAAKPDAEHKAEHKGEHKEKEKPAKKEAAAAESTDSGKKGRRASKEPEAAATTTTHTASPAKAPIAEEHAPAPAAAQHTPSKAAAAPVKASSHREDVAGAGVGLGGSAHTTSASPAGSWAHKAAGLAQGTPSTPPPAASRSAAKGKGKEEDEDAVVAGVAVDTESFPTLKPQAPQPQGALSKGESEAGKIAPLARVYVKAVTPTRESRSTTVAATSEVRPRRPRKTSAERAADKEKRDKEKAAKDKPEETKAATPELSKEERRKQKEKEAAAAAAAAALAAAKAVPKVGLKDLLKHADEDPLDYDGSAPAVESAENRKKREAKAREAEEREKSRKASAAKAKEEERRLREATKTRGANDAASSSDLRRNAVMCAVVLLLLGAALFVAVNKL